MGVMPAGMHRAVGLRAVLKPRIFMQWQSIHIAAQQHRAAVGRAFKGRNQTRCRWPVPKLKRKAGKCSLNLCERLGVLQTQFGFCMNGPPQVDKVGKNVFGVITPVSAV